LSLASPCSDFRWWARWLAAMAALGGMFCSAAVAQDEPAGNRTQAIRGTVINSVTREPLGHALVYSQDNRFATMTDPDGHFEFVIPQTASELDNLPSTLSARRPGFLEEPMPAPQNLRIGKDVTILLIPEGLIVGRVSLPNAEVSDPIEVQLLRREVRNGRAAWDTQASVTTRSNGEFRFAGLAAGTYALQTQEALDRDPEVFGRNTQLFGYPPVFYPAASDLSAAARIELSAGETFQADFSLARREYYQVKVPVEGAALSGNLAVTVSVQGREGPGYSLGYSARDRAITGMLPNGHYTVEAWTFGQDTASGVVNIAVNGSTYEGPRMTLLPDRSIAVNVNEEFTAQESADSQTASLSNGPRSVNQQRQRQVRHLNVVLEPAGEFGQNRPGSRSSRPVPDSNSVVLENVPPGRYWLRIFTDHGYAASASSGGTNLLQHPLVVGLGGASPAIEVTLRDDSAEIEGMIEGMENSGSVDSEATTSASYFPSVFIYCVPLPDSSGQFTQANASGNGKFNQSLPPGAYRVLAFSRPQPGLEYANPEAMQVYEAKGAVVRLVAGQSEHLRLPLIASGD
jgi:hypothetical protein